MLFLNTQLHGGKTITVSLIIFLSQHILKCLLDPSLMLQIQRIEIIWTLWYCYEVAHSRPESLSRVQSWTRFLNLTPCKWKCSHWINRMLLKVPVTFIILDHLSELAAHAPACHISGTVSSVVTFPSLNYRPKKKKKGKEIQQTNK